MPSEFGYPTYDSSSALFASGNYAELSARLAQELAAADAVFDRQRFIEVANDLACAHRAAGNLTTAAYFQVLSARAERDEAAGDVRRISPTSMGNLACDAILGGRWAVAESLLWKSLLSELAAGNSAGIAADWANLGLLAGLLGELEVARQRLWWALKLHYRLGDRFHMALDLFHLAQIFEAHGDWMRASKLSRRAAAEFAAIGHSALECAAQHTADTNAARAAVVNFDACVN